MITTNDFNQAIVKICSEVVGKIIDLLTNLGSLSDIQLCSGPQDLDQDLIKEHPYFRGVKWKKKWGGEGRMPTPDD